MVANSQSQNIHQKIEHLQSQAVAKHKEGKAAEALDLYLKTINLDCHQPDWLYGNAITLLGQLENFEQGLELGQQALTIHSNSHDLHRAIAIVCENKGDALGCIQNYQRAIAIELKQPDWLYCNLTKKLVETEQFDLAVEVGSQGIKIHGGFYPLHYALGQAFAGQENWEQAILAYQQVQQLQPNWSEVGHKLNQAIYHRSKACRLVSRDGSDVRVIEQNVADSVITEQSDNTPINLDIDSLFAHLRRQQLYVSSCQKIWHQIQNQQQLLNCGFWLSPSILYFEITVDSNYLFTQTSVLVCSDYKYAVAEAKVWKISLQQYAGIACFADNIYLEEHENYRLCLNDNNTLILIDGKIAQKAYNLELVEHLKEKTNKQKNLIRESISSYIIKHIPTEHKLQGKDLLNKLQYFLDVTTENFVEPNLPFKIFIDNSIPLKLNGLFVNGWLQDPYQMLEKITAVSALGFDWEISSQDIYRLERRDVRAYLQSTRYGNFEEKLGFCAYLPVPETIRASIDGLAELHSFRFVITLKGNIEIDITPDVQHGDCYHGRQQLMQIASPKEVSEEMLTNCLAPVGLRLQQLCMEQVRIKDVRVMGEPIVQPLISIIIPLYRRLDFMKVQLATMATDPAIKQCEIIYVLDSPEQEAEVQTFLQEHSALYQLPIKLVVMQSNSGYAAANNAGASQATGKYLVLLNSDVFAKTKGWMLEMAKFYANSPRIGALGAKLIYEDGSLQHAGMFFAKTTFPFWITLHYHKGLPGTYAPAKQTRAVPTVTGACLMIRKELYDQVGGLTTDYIIGDFEDSDLCLKCRELGYESWYSAEATLYHLERQSVPLNTVYNGSLAWQLNARLHHQRWSQQITQLMKIYSNSHVTSR